MARWYGKPEMSGETFVQTHCGPRPEFLAQLLQERGGEAD
jgi:hypothetical protein